MSNITTKLKFSRCREILDSRGTALLHLREREFTRGEPVIVNYYEDVTNNSSINTIVAVGIRNGHGKDCFRIITLGQYEIVWGIGDTLPDVSALVHDEVYLYRDENGVWYYVNAPDKLNRAIQPITPGNHIFLNLADNGIYVSDSDKQVRSITNTYTKDEIDSLIVSIAGGDFSGLGNLERRLADAYESIQEVIAINERLQQAIEEMPESVAYAAEFGEAFAAVQEKVSGLEVVDSETANVAGTLSSLTLREGSEDDNPIVINKTTVITTENIGDIVEPIPAATLEEELVV